MKRIVTWFAAIVVLGTGTLLLFAQSPRQPERVAQTVTSREKLRADVIKLRTEVEAIRFDYEIERDMLRDQVKMTMGLKLLPAMLGSLEGATISGVPNFVGPQKTTASAETPEEKQAAEAAAREQKKN